MNNKRQQENNIIFLLRICTCLLAVVSFWATAQGMINYTFPEAWQAYAASLGIQGLLLGLNFALPSFLRHCEKKSQKIALYLLTIVVLFCSSWFSYLFIANQAYSNSWTTERRLLAQSVYREELFKADTYTKLYIQDLQTVLMDQVIDSYQQSMQMDQNGIDVTESLNWDEERNRYTGNDFEAKDIMSTIISAMENATKGEVTQDVREQTNSVLLEMQFNMQSEIDKLNIQISENNARIDPVKNNLHDAENSLSNAPVGVDRADYEDSVSEALNTYKNLLTRQNELENQRNAYERALQRTSYYETVLGMSQEDTPSYYVGKKLQEIQRELFLSSPDVDKLLDLANDVFNRLQSGTNIATSTPKYQNLLISMNDFIQNLELYSNIKSSNATIQDEINKLAEGSSLSLNADESDSNWREEFNDLKSKISGLPVYVLENGSNLTTESFNRTVSINNLDQAIRLYLTEHNDAQAGLIYLMCPYREVAIFSLFLAFLLDIAAFVTGVIIDRVSSSRETEREESPIRSDIRSTQFPQRTEEMTWDITLGLNQYIFLTGDHTFIDGIITYKAILNGEQIELELPEPNLTTGLYLWDKKQLNAIEQSVLLFKGTSGGPQDGIYADCTLSYDEHLLTMTQSGKSILLGPVGSHIPVYLLSEDQYDVLPSNSIFNLHGQQAIIALNKDGDRIIAIYIIQ